ncbi:MAG: hypothetical protein IJS09_07265 [Treponema sp.]|nr:hypothetical protein [Treponema sp.]
MQQGERKRALEDARRMLEEGVSQEIAIPASSTPEAQSRSSRLHYSS